MGHHRRSEIHGRTHRSGNGLSQLVVLHYFCLIRGEPDRGHRRSISVAAPSRRFYLRPCRHLDPARGLPLITRYYGIDGSLVVPINGKGNQVMVSETDILVYTTLTGESYAKLHEIPVNFCGIRPARTNRLKSPWPRAMFTSLVSFRTAVVDSKVTASG